jgi:hypothetical protein
MQLVGSNQYPVPQGNVSLAISVGIPAGSQIALQPSWTTDANPSNVTLTGLVANFAIPAPVNAYVNVLIVSLAPEPNGLGDSTLAGDIVNSVRDLIPDPTPQYLLTGIPDPDGNGGLVRASTMYRWLDFGVRRMAQACGSIINDWTAIAQRQGQPWYRVNPKFITVDSGFSNQWPLQTVILMEEDTIWPSTSINEAQALTGYYRRVTDHVEFGLWPVPQKTDPVTTLAAPLGASAGDPIYLTSTAGFLSYGYVQIDNEIIQYQMVLSGSPAGIAIISRAQGGTTQAAHNTGAGVQHLGLWIKGKRAPGKISSSQSVVELPTDIVTHLETYLLACARRSENEHAEARALMKDFNEVCVQLRADPDRRENMGQIRAFGDTYPGNLYWPNSGGVVVPALLLGLTALFSCLSRAFL